MLSQNFFDPPIQKSKLLFSVEPVLAVLHDGEAGTVAADKSVHRLPGRQVVVSGVEDLGGDVPGDGVFPDVAEITPGEGLPEGGWNFAALLQLRLRYAGPAHHVQDQPLHVQDRGDEERLCKRAALQGVHRKIGPDAVGKDDDMFTLPARLRTGSLQLAAHLPGQFALIIDAGTPGMTVGKSEVKMGLHGLGLNPVYYDNCIVPKENLLGKVGEGLDVAKDSLYDARLYVAAASVGCAQAAIELAVAYSKQRLLNGKRLSSFQNTQFVLAEAQTKVDAARLLTMRCADMMDKKKHETYMSSMAKYYASEICGEVVDKCLQVFGGYGYCRDYDVERIYRDVRVYRILDGATEVH